jgi:hypothetical protein
MNAAASGRNNPFGSKLNAIFSSDIGHFDVIDMRHPLPEAYELVEDGYLRVPKAQAAPPRRRCSCQRYPAPQPCAYRRAEGACRGRKLHPGPVGARLGFGHR